MEFLRCGNWGATKKLSRTGCKIHDRRKSRINRFQDEGAVLTPEKTTGFWSAPTSATSSILMNIWLLKISNFRCRHPGKVDYPGASLGQTENRRISQIEHGPIDFDDTNDIKECQEASTIRC